MRDLERADQSLLQRRLLKVDTSVVVDAPPEKVWELISDHSTWPDWHDDYEAHEPLTDRTAGLGATFRSKEWFVLRSENEITRWDDGRAVGLSPLRATFWPWLIKGTYNEIEVEPVAGNNNQATVHYRLAFRGTLIFWLLSAYSVAHALASSYFGARSTLKKIKAAVEGS